LKKNYTKLDPNVPILVVYRSGRRSRLSSDFLTSKGYAKVYNMAGGMLGQQGETSGFAENKEVKNNLGNSKSDATETPPRKKSKAMIYFLIGMHLCFLLVWLQRKKTENKLNIT